MKNRSSKYQMRPILCERLDTDTFQGRCEWCGLKATISTERWFHACSSSPPSGHPLLLGDRVARLTSLVGIKPCGGCNKRKRFLNRADAKVRATTRKVLGGAADALAGAWDRLGGGGGGSDG